MHEVTYQKGPLLFEPDMADIKSMMALYTDLVNKVLPHLTPDLLKPEYREENATNPTFGHCYVASEVIYHIAGPQCTPYYGKDENGITHWWLMDDKWGIRIDATCEQYMSKGKMPPYHVGKRASFLTNEPSKRAVIVTERMYGNV